MPTANVNGLKIGYTDTEGAGPPVVLIHAFPLNRQMWDPQVRALGDRFRLIAPDLIGFGESDAPDDRGSYSMGAFADEIKGLIDQLGLDRVALMGLSIGGYIAFEFIRRYPDALSALVLADTKAEADPPEAVEKRSGQQEQVEAEGTSGLIEALPNALLGETTRSSKPDVVNEAKRVMDNPPAGFIGALEAMKQRPDSTGDLTGISVPTLIVVGEEDGVTPPDFSRSMHEAIGGSQLAVIPDAGHLSSLESPDQFNGALSEFLTSL